MPRASFSGDAVRAVVSRRWLSLAGLNAVLLLVALACAQAASGAGSERGLRVIATDDFSAMTLSSDGTPWFAGFYDHRVTHVTEGGRVTRYRLPMVDPGFITWGVDGALWMRDENFGGFARMTPDGHVTRYRYIWATQDTLGGTPPGNIIRGPDGTVWFGDRERHRITSVASDGSTRVVARVDRRIGPELLATGGDGSVWFHSLSGGAMLDNGLGRVRPDGHVEAMRYRTSEFPAATVAPNGDVWFVRLTRAPGKTRTAIMRIDPHGHVTEFRAPELDALSITLAADGAVWLAGSSLVRMDRTGHFERIRAAGWETWEVLAAPSGRIWLIVLDEKLRNWAGWLPPNPCLSRRRITVHLRSRRGDPIRAVRASVQGRDPFSVRGRNPRVLVDLRGYLPGAVRVTLRVRTAHRRYTRHRVFHTCGASG